MARFLNTSATNYYLEELIKGTRERLIVISPFLRFNERIKELLEDKDRMKIDVRLVYGKSELAPQEINWLRSLEFVRTSFCQHLHAKCYLNERAAIITSMNLYDFSQVNNNEMGVYIERDQAPDLYRDTYEEAQRLIRVSEQVRLSAETVDETEDQDDAESPEYEKLTTARLAKSAGVKTPELIGGLLREGLLEKEGSDLRLTDAGKRAGGELRYSRRYGPFFIWPRDIDLPVEMVGGEDDQEEESPQYEKLTTSRLARSLGMKTAKLVDKLLDKGLLERDGSDLRLTDAGKEAGGEFRYSRRYGPFFIWPRDLQA